MQEGLSNSSDDSGDENLSQCDDLDNANDR